MRGFRKTLLVLLTGVAMSLGAGTAFADFISYTLDTPNAALSVVPGPYGTVTVTLVDSSHASVVFTASAPHNGYTFTFGGAQAADVNVNATTFSVTNATASNPLATLTVGSGQADGFGNFNVAIDSSDGVTDSSSTISFGLTLLTGTLWASASNVLVNNAAGFPVAAHIFAVNPTTGTVTGFASVPIPAAAWLFGSGLLGLIAIARRRINKGSDTLALA